MFHVEHEKSGSVRFETIIDFKKLLDLNGFKYNDQIIERFKFYHYQILQWNKKSKLVSRNDEKRLVSRHFIESLMFLKGFNFTNEMKTGDLGSGAGFPGLVMKLFDPKLNIYLIESNKKKSLFLSFIIEELNLKGVEIIHDRVENLYKDKKFLQFFDIITARAVAKYQKIVDWVRPVLKIKTGHLLIPRLAFKNRKFDFVFSTENWNFNKNLVEMIKNKNKPPEKLEYQIFTRVN